MFLYPLANCNSRLAEKEQETAKNRTAWGTKKRRRIAVKTDPALVSRRSFLSSYATLVDICSALFSAQFGDWGEWEACTTTCGTGQRKLAAVIAIGLYKI